MATGRRSVAVLEAGTHGFAVREAGRVAAVVDRGVVVVHAPLEAAVEVHVHVTGAGHRTHVDSIDHQVTLPEEPSAAAVVGVLVVGAQTHLHAVVAVGGLVAQGEARTGVHARTLEGTGRHHEVHPVLPDILTRVDLGTVLLVVAAAGGPSGPVLSCTVISREGESSRAVGVLHLKLDVHAAVGHHLNQVLGVGHDEAVIGSREVEQADHLRCTVVTGLRTALGFRRNRSTVVADVVRRDVALRLREQRHVDL